MYEFQGIAIYYADSMVSLLSVKIVFEIFTKVHNLHCFRGDLRADIGADSHILGVKYNNLLY